MPRKIVTSIAKPPIVRLVNATFYREHTNAGSGPNPQLFPGTNWELCLRDPRVEYWAIVGPAGSGKTTFLEILRGDHACDPPLARSYPYLPQIGISKRQVDPRVLRNREVGKAIRYAGFGGKGSKLGGLETRGTYMAARYESRHEAEDFTLRNYLLGRTEANPSEDSFAYTHARLDGLRLNKVAKALQLENLLDLPALVLSNGQTRRARIAKAFMEFPVLLLLDEPFLGIDPIHHRILSPALWSLSRRAGPNIVLALANDQTPPRWITHLMCLDNCRVVLSGPKEVVYEQALKAGYPLATIGQKRQLWKGFQQDHEDERDEFDDAPEVDAEADGITSEERIAEEQNQAKEADSITNQNDGEVTSRLPRYKLRWNNQVDLIRSLEIGEPVIEMKGVQVDYGKIVALGDWHQESKADPGLHWTIRRGERWGIFGPNGSGKTTILSLVNSDHPKSYSQSISYFGKSRLPEPGQAGISIFDLQAKIMQASPEVHAFFPKHLTIRATLENAWAETFLARPALTHQADKIVDASLRWFEKELNPRYAGSDPVMVLSEWWHHPRLKPAARVALYQERRPDWADEIRFSEVSFAAQRVALFLRAIIKKPDVVILDEAFSGMDKDTRTKCMMFLAYGETKWLGPIRRPHEDNDLELDALSKFVTPLVNLGQINISPFESRQSLVVVSHEQEEVPPIVDQYLFLEEPGTKKAPRTGSIPGMDSFRVNQRANWWNKMWNHSVHATNRDRYHRSYHRDQYLKDGRG